MRRALLLSVAIAFALACGDNITQPVPERTTAVTPPVSFATTTTEDGLSISTDKDDYQPGDVVHLTGSGWQPGDVLDIVLTDDPLTHDPHTWTVNVEADGTFHDQTYVVDEGDLNVSFTLVATSRGTGRSLTVNFTDSQPQKVTVTPASLSINQGGTANYTVDVQVGGNNTNPACTIKLSVVPTAALPAGTTFSFSGGDEETTNSDINKTLTFNTLATTPPSTINFNVQAARIANCQGQGTETSDPLTLNILGPATKLAFSTQPPTSTQAGASFAVTVQVVDDAGHAIAAVTSVTLAIADNPGGGTLTGTLTRTTAANGSVTFPGLSINKAGNGYTLAATGTGLTGATSSTFNITVGPAIQLAFTTQPGGGAPGAPISPQPVVAVQDAGGNTVTGSTAPITLAILSGTGTAGAALACTPSNTKAAAAGVASFAGCSINLAGTNYQLRASTTTSGIAAVNSNAFNIVANNQPPVLAAIGNKTIGEESQLAFTSTATDENVASLQFSLANPATGTFPTGAQISAGGAFTWTPTEAQGPGTYRVKVVVTDNGSLTDDEEIAITVTEVNEAPVLEAIGNKSVNEGSALTFTAEAADPDVPANALTFSLDGAPAGATINASTGAFSWTPADDDPTGTPSDAKTFKVVVKDDGTPQLLDEETITITVNNVAPEVSAGGDYTGNEGEAVQLQGSISDPGADSHIWEWKYVPGTNVDPGATCSFYPSASAEDPTITCTDDGSVELTLKVTDDDLGEGTDKATLTLANLPPIANAGGPYSGEEGSWIEIHGSADDPGNNDDPYLTYKWTLNTAGIDEDGSCTIENDTQKDTRVKCTDDSDDATGDHFTLTLVAKDDDNAYSQPSTANLTVTNATPVADAGGGVSEQYTGYEGSPKKLDGSATDAGTNDKFQWSWQYTAGPGFINGATCQFDDATVQSPNITCNDNGTVQVTLMVGDDDGASSSDGATFIVQNVNPTAIAGGPYSGKEGSGISLAGSRTDPGSNDTHTYEWTYAAGADVDAGAACVITGATTLNASINCNDDGTYQVTLKVTDDDGGIGTSTVPVPVANELPVISSLTKADGSAIPTSVIIGASLDLKAVFGDAGSHDTHKAQIDCGVGYTDVNGSGDDVSPVLASCTFPSIGPKTIKVKVTDDEGDFDEETRTILVAYNFAGFFAPVDRPNTMNVSKAGQAIPLKWRLTDALGRPITDLTSVTVQSVGMPCGTYTGTDVIEEYAAGTSGLQNLGDGNYQFNWKTPTNYVGTCKSIALVFGAGALSYVEGPHAFFTFKK